MATAAHAQTTLSVLASADGEIQFSGVLGYTVEDSNATLRTVRSGGNNVRHSIYEFSLAGLPSDAIITAARLRLTTGGIVSNTGSTADVFFYAFGGDGVITEDDHGNLTSAALVSSQTFQTASNGPPNGSFIDIDFSDIAAVQDALDNGSSFLTVRSETVNFVTFTIRSLENTNSATVYPTLEITYIPAPASVLTLALGSLVVARRRRA